MFCPNCGNELPDGVAFCDICGEKLNAGEGAGQTPPEVPAGQPMTTQGAYDQMPPQGQPYGQVPPQRASGAKKTPMVPILISVVAVLFIGIGVLLYFFVFKSDDDKVIDASQGASVTESAEPGQNDTEPDDEPDVSEEPDDSEEPEATVEPTPESTPAPDPDDMNTWSTQDRIAHAEKLSTEKKPKINDFKWLFKIRNSDEKVEDFFAQDGFVKITNLSLVDGGWKAIDTWKTKGKSNWVSRIVNVELRTDYQYNVFDTGVPEYNIEHTSKRWRYYYEDGSWDSESKDKKKTWDCNTDSEGRMYTNLTDMDDEKDFTVRVQFYEKDGKQYGIGKYEYGKYIGYMAYVRG